ncbi:MAG: hypothetical protein K2O71_03205 [Lachnospiraceae bacterium]|nr:hypothetical protein [Lachnospiraceae bacterium]
MMKFKKFLASAMTGAMMLGLVATATPAVSAYAETSAKLGTSEATVFHLAQQSRDVPSGPAIDYKTMTVEVPSDDPFVIVKFYKDKDKLTKPSNTYVYPVTGSAVTIDLGFYKPGRKEAYIEYYGSGNTKTEIGHSILAKEVNKLKLKIDTTKDDFLAALNEKSSTKLESLEGYSYRPLYGTEWKDLSVFANNYKTAKVAGTTIVVRQNATENGPASAEVKLKIGGMAKAPTLKINYEKDTIGVDKVQYALVENAVNNNYRDPESKPLSFEDLKGKFDNPTEAFTIAVRTNKNGKVSMPSIYTCL